MRLFDTQKTTAVSTENISTVVLFAVLLAYPLAFGSFAVLNLSYFLSFAIMSLSLTLIWGYAGIFSMGQPAFFGIGAYVYGILAINYPAASVSLVWMLVGTLVAGVAALALGYFMFYGGVNDVFASLTTWAVALVGLTFLNQTANEQRWHVGDALLGGFNGMRPIPSLSVGFGDWSVVLFGMNFYYFVLGLFLATFVAIRIVRRTRWGYVLVALQDNRERTKTFGYDVCRQQMIVFGIGGALAGLSGVLYASWSNFVAPDVMSITACTLPIVLVAAGGRKNVTATSISSILLMYLMFKLSASGTEWAFVILGLVLVLVVLFVPNGLIVALFDALDAYVVKPLLGVRRRPSQVSESAVENTKEVTDASRGH